jgi:hypothetical protein
VPTKFVDDPVKVVPPPTQGQPVQPQPAQPQPAQPQPVQPQPTQPQPTQPVTTPVAPPAPVLTYKTFKLDLALPHYVVMLLDKVDPVYVNEAKNALMRFHREIGNGQAIEINKDTLSTNQNLLVYVQFANSDEALQYYEKVKRAAPVEISWLPANKYSFFIISEPNLQLLKTNKDISGYTKLLNMQYPGKF